MPAALALTKAGLITYTLKGDGTTDDTAAIQAALDAANANGGGTVHIPAGTYATTAPLVIPQYVTLTGTDWSQGSNTVIKPKSTFSGSYCVWVKDGVTAGYTGYNRAHLTNLTLDGTNVIGSLVGVRVDGYTAGFTMNEVRVQHFTSHGFTTGAVGGNKPLSFNIRNCLFYQNGGDGVQISTGTDSTLTNVYCLGNTGQGFSLSEMANSLFVACRAEWSGENGFYVTNAWGSSTGSGGGLFVDCSTDRNTKNGFLVDSTGNATIQLTGIQCRRDGRNGGSGGGSYAGFKVNAASSPVLVNGLTVYPGVDDDGSGTNSPQYGISSTSAIHATFTGGYVHAASTPVNNGGSNTFFVVSGITLVTGTTASPSIQSQANLDIRGRALGVAQAVDHGYVAWAYDPSFVRTSYLATAGTIYLSAVYITDYRILSKISWYLDTAGVSPTASQNWVALLDSTGTVLQSTNVDSSVTASPGVIATTITNQSVSPGMYWVAWVFNAGTTPKLGVSGDQNSGLSNAGLSAATYRYATNGTSQTSITNRTPASNTASAHTTWCAVS